MTTETGDDSDAIDETPADLDLRRPATAERKSFATLELALRATIRSLREIRRGWDEATPDRQKAMAEDVEEDARELGDAGHDLARLMKAIRFG